MEELKDIVLLHDADIFAYRAASATDGRQYVVEWEAEGKHYEEPINYKKDALLKAAEVDGIWALEYQPEPVSHCYHIIKTLMKQVKEDLRFRIKDFPSEFHSEESYLTNRGSFRETIDPEYKVNRKDIRRPEHLGDAKAYLTKNYGAITRVGELEADDLLAIRMTHWQAEGYTPICVSIDKDLLQVGGWHWNFVKKELTYVDTVSGDRSFYHQLLTGDSTDGIIGIKGVGPKTAEKLINHLSDPFEMYKVCLDKWLKSMPQDSGELEDVWIKRVVDRVHLNARLLYLLRAESEHWVQPKESHAEDTKLVPALQGL